MRTSTNGETVAEAAVKTRAAEERRQVDSSEISTRTRSSRTRKTSTWTRTKMKTLTRMKMKTLTRTRKIPPSLKEASDSEKKESGGRGAKAQLELPFLQASNSAASF